MFNSFKKQIRYWKAASLGLPIIALFSLVIADLLDRGIYDHMMNCVLMCLEGFRAQKKLLGVAKANFRVILAKIYLKEPI